jgi:hypothetical protein
MTEYKDLLFNEFDSISDKIVALNNNDLFLKQYADRLTQGYYYNETITAQANLSNAATTVLNAQQFWVPQPDRMILIKLELSYYTLYTGTNQVRFAFEVDGTQISEFYSGLLYSASTTQPAFFSSFHAIANVDNGAHTLTVKANKINASPQVGINAYTVRVMDIGKQIAAEA